MSSVIEVFPKKNTFNVRALAKLARAHSRLAVSDSSLRRAPSATVRLVSISDVQTMADFDDAVAPVALRTPLYLVISLVGVFIAICAFLPWAGVKQAGEGEVVGGPTDGFITSINGLDAGGWGLGALVAGIAIAVLSVLGYFWNPFSDPEAMFIAGFGAVVAFAALVKIVDPASLFLAAAGFDAPNASSRLGLWLLCIAGLDAMLSGLWILFSRPKALARLSRSLSATNL